LCQLDIKLLADPETHAIGSRGRGLHGLDMVRPNTRMRDAMFFKRANPNLVPRLAH